MRTHEGACYEHGEGFVRIALCKNARRPRRGVRSIKALTGGAKKPRPAASAKQAKAANR